MQQVGVAQAILAAATSCSKVNILNCTRQLYSLLSTAPRCSTSSAQKRARVEWTSALQRLLCRLPFCSSIPPPPNPLPGHSTQLHLNATTTDYTPCSTVNWDASESTDVSISFGSMLTWAFSALACATSFTSRPVGSTFQLQWFGEDREGSSKQDAFNHQPFVTFPCSTNSSAPPATSVHQLRPQDVEICER